MESLLDNLLWHNGLNFLIIVGNTLTIATLPKKRFRKRPQLLLISLAFADLFMANKLISCNMAAAHAKCATFWTFTNAVKNFTKRNMEISLTLSKIVLLLLKRPYVCMSPNPVLRNRCMNLSLNSVYSKYTANSDFPTLLELCPFLTTSAIHLFKNMYSKRSCSRTEKKQLPSCSCLRSPNRTRITRCRTLF